MVLLRTRVGNGYGCSCCAHEYEDAEWIEDKEMKPFSWILDQVYDMKNGWYKDRDNTRLEHIYEKDGKVLYGYTINFRTRRQDVFVVIGKRKYQVIEDYDEISKEKGKTRKEIEKIWENREEALKWF